MRIQGKLSFDRAERALSAGAREGIRAGLEVLLSESRARVPVKTGALRASAMILERGELAGEILYPLPYAQPQHERSDFAHPGGGEDHYLSGPADDPGVQRDMERALAEALRGRL